tara:strand:+ start:29535 stop:30320 length:786 start_codon:yes stop_codon:yes gene_type:complete
MKTALLISTYNWPEALDLVLKSALNQSQFPDEILIADDGSKEATKALINNYQEKSTIPIKHIWQEDKGFRRSAILNKAIASSDCDYVIQIDGDCIIHKDFVKDHISISEEGMFLFGSRVNIKKNALSDIFKNDRFQFSFFSGDIGKRTRNLRIPLLRDRYKASPLFSSKVRGCNISYWRKDFLAVNGYNEEMEGWGREDSEFILRVLNKGVLGKRLRYGGIVYHLYHPESSKSNLIDNEKIQQKTNQEKLVWCENGVTKYL